jgi:hypothetical protein
VLTENKAAFASDPEVEVKADVRWTSLAMKPSKHALRTIFFGSKSKGQSAFSHLM